MELKLELVDMVEPQLAHKPSLIKFVERVGFKTNLSSQNTVLISNHGNATYIIHFVCNWS